MKRTSLAGWIFAGPSLIVLGVFFPGRPRRWH